MPSNPYAPPPQDAAVARPGPLKMAITHPFGRAALTVALCAVIFAGLGLTIPGIVVVAAGCASAGINVRRGFGELSPARETAPNSRLPPAHSTAAWSGGGVRSCASAPAAPSSDGVRRLASAVAVVGSAAAVAVLLAFYLPGMIKSRKGLDEILVVLALPAIAMALPFALLSFIRVRLILLIASAVLAWTLIGAATDLFSGPPDGRGESLIVFALITVINFITVVAALVVDATYRAARRSKSPDAA